MVVGMIINKITKSHSRWIKYYVKKGKYIPGEL